MFKRLGWCVALLILVPAGAEAQQASIQVSARVVSRVETQRVVAQSTMEAGVIGGDEGVPESWRWEIHVGTGGESLAWASQPIAAGRGGAQLSGASRVAMSGLPGSEVAYLFAPI